LHITFLQLHTKLYVYRNHVYLVSTHILVPDDWGVITEHFIERPLHNRSFTITCKLSPVLGMKLPVYLQWSLPNGSEVTSCGNRTIGNVSVTHSIASSMQLQTYCQNTLSASAPSEISMRFNPILNSDGGTYSCKASVFASWMREQPQQIIKPVLVAVISECVPTIVYLYIYN